MHRDMPARIALWLLIITVLFICGLAIFASCTTININTGSGDTAPNVGVQRTAPVIDIKRDKEKDKP